MKSVEIISESDSDVMLVAFGGIANGIDMPPFEFMGMFSSFDMNKVFIRDLDQCYYHSGLKGVTTNVDETVDYIAALIRDKRTLFVGHSMGGYAALLFGILSGADRILAFAPQITLKDHRWQRYMNKATTVGGYGSLAPLIKTSEMPIEIYFSEAETRDKKHVDLIQCQENITAFGVNQAGHHIAVLLKRAGKLQEIISTNVLLLTP